MKPKLLKLRPRQAAINNKDVCPVEGGDAVNIIKILELAESSSRTGKTVALV